MFWWSKIILEHPVKIMIYKKALVEISAVEVAANT